MLELAILGVLIAAPLLRILFETLSPDAIVAWSDVTSGRLARNLLWVPLSNTLILGVGVACGCVLIGGFLAWLVVMTDVPFRRTIGLLATLPFMIPSFATALGWGSLVLGSRVGGESGVGGGGGGGRAGGPPPPPPPGRFGEHGLSPLTTSPPRLSGEFGTGRSALGTRPIRNLGYRTVSGGTDRAAATQRLFVPLRRSVFGTQDVAPLSSLGGARTWSGPLDFES